MKIAQKKLQQIIKEEIIAILAEQVGPSDFDPKNPNRALIDIGKTDPTKGQFNPAKPGQTLHNIPLRPEDAARIKAQQADPAWQHAQAKKRAAYKRRYDLQTARDRGWAQEGAFDEIEAQKKRPRSQRTHYNIRKGPDGRIIGDVTPAEMAKTRANAASSLKHLEKEVVKLGRTPRAAGRLVKGAARSVARMLGPAMIGLELGITASDIEHAYKAEGMDGVGKVVRRKGKEWVKMAAGGHDDRDIIEQGMLVQTIAKFFKKHSSPIADSREGTGAGGTQGSIRW